MKPEGKEHEKEVVITKVWELIPVDGEEFPEHFLISKKVSNYIRDLESKCMKKPEVDAIEFAKFVAERGWWYNRGTDQFIKPTPPRIGGPIPVSQQHLQPGWNPFQYATEQELLNEFKNQK